MLKQGIYEHLINKEIEKEILETESKNYVCKKHPLDDSESPNMLANYLSKLIRNKLAEVENVQDRVNFINKILQDTGVTDENQISDNTNLLNEVLNQQQAVLQEQTKNHTIRPLSGFNVSNLFTGGNSKIPLGEEIRREIASANEIYMIVSFLRLSGVNIILDELKKFCAKEGNKLHIITTTYGGITQDKAVERLAELPNTEIHISYNNDNERLHAKSYIFVRNSGLHTAYIGSSNLSKSAQTEGLEWNIRVTSIENPHIIKTALATFEMYWNSPNFEDFNEGGITKFREKLKSSKFEPNLTHRVYQRYNLLPHQKQILDELTIERVERNNYKNLIVAATGTGKTVISAFDFLQFKRQHPHCRFLFTAHREEILKQSIHTYRSVLQDANFGALWVGNITPQDTDEFNNLFISVAMLNSRFENVFANLDPTYYDYIVIDEAHHSQADSYRKLFDHFQPKVLLGLTATPERMDGKDLRPDFGGRISAEIRLPQALQAGLLTPFQYLCITDETDLSGNELWSGQKYITEQLSEALCTKQRAQAIADALHRYLADEYTCRALCFCVNKKHAEFMASELQKQGFMAQSLTSDDTEQHRKQSAADLRDGKIHYLCVVDIFNEGVDIPEIDTVLFLRPTESLTIFLQQLGRGLRLAPGKTELTVLDFVAQANKKYDFTNKFRALTLKPTKNIQREVQEGFTSLPTGCTIVMEKKARQYILENIQSAIYDKKRIIREINSYSELPTLAQFLEANGQDIRQLYKDNRCWTEFKRLAGRIEYADDAITKYLTKGMNRLLHFNTLSFLHFVERFIQGNPVYKAKNNKTYALMLYYTLFQGTIANTGFSSIYDALDLVHQGKYHFFKEEMGEIIAYLIEHLNVKTQSLENGLYPGLDLYGCFTREDVFVLTGKQTETLKMQGAAAGVFDLKDQNTTLLFVTLNKSDKDFSPSTQYDDYVINENYFHWQSQNKDAHSNKGGKRYTEQKLTNKKILLFVREDKEDGFGNTSPFHCFGLVDYVTSHGDLPMNVTWKLKEPALPQYLKAL